jgi:Ca-activated chloride channel homolog
VGQQPAVLVPTTASKDALRDGLNQAQPSETPADWEAAAALAAGSVRAGEAEDSIIVIVSDGGLPANLPPMPTEVRYVPMGASGDNLAIEALALRPAKSGPELFASVANYGPAARAVIVSFYAGGQLFSAEERTVPAGGRADVVLDGLPAQPAVYEARLSLPAGSPDAALDALPLDDRAYAVYRPPSAGRVLLISDGNVFLEQVFTALSGSLGLSPFRLKAGQPLPAEPFDLYVFDGVISGTLPTGADLLLVNPPDNELFEVGGTYTNTTPARVLPDPLTQFVDWSGVHLLQARDIGLPPWARPLVQTDVGPLVFAGEQGGRRVAVLAFDLHDSDLPLQVTFPVLMSNLLGYLAPAQAFSADGLKPGEALVIKPGGGEALVVVDPAGQEYAAPPTEAGVIFAHTNRLGLYTVRSNQAVLGQFAVNLFDPAESNITPAATIRIGRTDVAAAPREAQGEYELWPWLAVLALALLLAEWWVYHRGNVLPMRRRAIGN